MRSRTVKRGKSGVLRRFLRTPVICGFAVAASAVIAPTMVSAFVSRGDSVPVAVGARGALGSFTPASIDPRLLARVSLHTLVHGKLFRFTPAGIEGRPARSVTVAVRVVDGHPRLIASHPAVAEPGTGLAALRIAPVAFNLGVARGYQSFALPQPATVIDTPRDRGELRTYSLAAQSGSVAVAPPRLGPDVTFDARNAPGRLPGTLGTQGDYQVSMGGAYRLGHNLDLTAGLRYSSDRERLRPLTDHRQDSQAIYVGTQFRF